jgi:hypothetical protein
LYRDIPLSVLLPLLLLLEYKSKALALVFERFTVIWVSHFRSHSLAFTFFPFFPGRQEIMSNLSIRGAQQLSSMSLQYLSNTSWLLADQRFRLGVAVALPCVFLALAWRTIASKDTTTPQEPTSTEKPSTQAQKPQTKPNDITTKPATVAPATNTRVTMRAPHPITATANAPTQAPAVPPKAATAAAVRAPRYRRTVPEKKSEVVVVQVEEDERPATPETPTSKPKRKSTTIAAEFIAPVLLAQEQQQQHHYPEQHQRQHQRRAPAPRQEQDTASIGSSGSSEHQPSSASSNYKNKTVRMGKNLKRAWSKRPFAWNSPTAPPVHAGESILFPDSPTIPSVNLRA